MISGGGGVRLHLGRSGELLGKSGELGEPLDDFKIRSERSFGEVAGELPGKFGKSRQFPEALGSSTPTQRHAKFVSKGDRQQGSVWVYWKE